MGAGHVFAEFLIKSIHLKVFWRFDIAYVCE